jgi:UDP-hydrolysing UDP-N-acetyl-D-glucosamine 2-epimerase
MKIRTVCVITGTRSEYGLLKPVMLAIKENKKLKLQLIVTGMHLLKKHGYTYKEIIKDGFKIDKLIKIDSGIDNNYGMCLTLCNGINRISKCMKELKPDVILVLGDRGEALAGAIVGKCYNIPVAHIHGGDKSGCIDDKLRDIITKLSYVHFPATKKSAERIRKILVGENHEM